MTSQSLDPQESHPSTLYFSVWDRERVFEVPTQDEMVIGWATDSNQIAIDLTPYHGRLLGVSRQHARILSGTEGIFIEDLNSTKGTLLNGTQLESDRSYTLQDGDEIRVGDLYLTVHFTAG